MEIRKFRAEKKLSPRQKIEIRILKNEKFLAKNFKNIFEKSGKNFLQKNAKNCKICGGKKILKNKISARNFKKKFAEKCCSGAEKSENNFLKNGENFEIEKNFDEKNLENLRKNFEKIKLKK